VKQALRLESGMNDVILLPIVLVATTILASGDSLTGREWGRTLLSMLVLSPLAGIFVGVGAVGALALVRPRIGVRRDYESFYSLGVAFAAFAAGESVHGSGFLAAFFAGLTISALDVELCDCFRDYGETTAEMTLLFTFVLLGTSVIWSGLGVIAPATLLFAAVAFLARPLVFVPALLPAPLTWPNRAIIAWFGPRGLSSLLLVLLPVFSGISGSENLLAICCLVVLLSVLVHGLSPGLLVRPEILQTAPVDKPSGTAPPAPAPHSLQALPEGDFITVEMYGAAVAAGASPVLLDVRSEKDYNRSDEAIAGALRIHPDNVVRELEGRGIAHETPIVAICACPEDATSERVVRELRRSGWPNARALRDGWSSWKRVSLPVVPKT
jgi:rhodanese-related sulfurtransferase